ncbi:MULTISPECIES: serine hydrolase domain-containing protein [unclassified Streptomyces]|uniref:serine hydrolase domain-containing protein n=1 Tax=unclassified Streptomyces TaxID=2593676 RepID=UPI00035FCC94|nr:MULTISPECIES: serine hydrolase domain-containing protein [unclassified Streptomyces]
MKRRAFLALSTAAATAAAAPTLAGPAAATTGTGLDTAALRQAVSGLPDGDATAALVRVGGRAGAWHGGGGVHDLASGRAADPHARFRAGSTTKVVTAAAVLRLAAARRVDPDAPVQHYLPRLFRGTEFHRPVSVRQLLNHTSGIPAGIGWGDAFADQYAHRFDVLPPLKVVTSALAKRPEFLPGTRQHYLNINYTILGLLIERVTGQSYADVATRLVLRPAGMRHTYFPGADPTIRGAHNRGYQLVDGEFVDVTEWVQADRWAAGDMISTTADLERLIVSLFRGRIVPAPQLKEMFTVPAGIDGATRTAGLQRMDLGDLTFWGKTGARYGYNTAIAAARDLSRTLVYSVNATDAKDEEMNPVAQRIVMAAARGA